MATSRKVSMLFWADTKVVDDFTPEDKYFYLYLFTNPHTNSTGCYELSMRQMVAELGYSQDSIEKLIERFKTMHKVIDYCKETKEILVINWHKYNWSKSPKFTKGLEKEVEDIKCEHFKKYILATFDAFLNDTLCIPYVYCMDTVSIQYGYSMDTVSDKEKEKEKNQKKKNKENTPILNSNINNIYINNTVKNKDYIYKQKVIDNINKYNISDYLKEYIYNWINYKIERNNFRYKDIGLNTLIKTISENAEKHGDDAVAKVIQESISSGYQGIIFDKIKSKTARARDGDKDILQEWRDA